MWFLFCSFEKNDRRERERLMFRVFPFSTGYWLIKIGIFFWPSNKATIFFSLYTHTHRHGCRTWHLSSSSHHRNLRKKKFFILQSGTHTHSSVIKLCRNLKYSMLEQTNTHTDTDWVSWKWDSSFFFCLSVFLFGCALHEKINRFFF